MSDGLLLIDKADGPTSHDVVQRVRRALKTRRVGHSGTLDPFATGLLLVAVGRATRLLRFLPHSPKGYEGTIRLGETSDTDDGTGQRSVSEAPLPAAEAVIAAASEFVGPQQQLPPRVSARKVDGQRLYKLARKGVEVEVEPRSVQIDRFELSPGDEPAFHCDVSAGTYIRSLARDLGAKLGCGGLVEELRRTAIGPISVESAVSIDDPALAERLIPLADMPLEPARLTLAAAAAARFRQGNPVEAPDGAGLRSVLAESGELLGVGELDGPRLQPRVVLA